MQFLSQISLAPVAAGYLKNDGTSVAVNCTVNHSSTGSWEIILSQPLLEGQYIAIVSPNANISNCLVALFDGSATSKFVSSWVGGVSADFNVSFAIFALPVIPDADFGG